MKYTFKIEELDCAHCASKIEAELNKLCGVTKANVNYLSEKITLESDIEKSELFDKVKKIAEKVEPDCKISL